MRARRFSDPTPAERKAQVEALRLRHEAAQAAHDARVYDQWVILRAAALRYSSEFSRDPHHPCVLDAEAKLKAAAQSFARAADGEE